MKTIQLAIDIAAPIERVWAELSAISEYAEWNPFITECRGDLIPGNRLQVRIEPPGGRAMSFRPTVTDVKAGRRFEWLGRLGLPGVFDGRHSFELEPLAEGGTRLIQTERFSGVLVPLFATVLRPTRAGFQMMNEAVRERAERAATGHGTI